MRKYIGLALVTLLLAACASSPYEQGKSVADIPSHIDVINLKRVFLYGGEADDPLKDAGPHNKPDPLEEKDPSTNDQEVLAIAKTNILSQLTNLGYTVVEDDKTKGDVAMSFAVSYMPERVLFVHRQVGVQGMVYDPNGNLLFRLGQGKASAGGAFGSMVQTRDELVSDCTREAVVKVVTEMRKGTLDNQPVSKHEKVSMLLDQSNQSGNSK
jgi:hypothetical protein